MPANTEVPPSRARDSSADQQARYGASAYIDQSEYDSYKQPTINSSSQITKHDGGNRGAYSNYSTDNNKNRYIQDTTDDDYTTTVTNDYSTAQQQQQQYYTKNSSTTSYSGL
jgi:hypothetical protein